MNLEPLREEIQVSTDVFSRDELVRVLRKVKIGKACGHDAIPPDFWRALLHDEQAVDELLLLMNECWDRRFIPDSWRISTVVLLFKKGDASLPSSYRPISLLPAG